MAESLSQEQGDHGDVDSERRREKARKKIFGDTDIQQISENSGLNEFRATHLTKSYDKWKANSIWLLDRKKCLI